MDESIIKDKIKKINELINKTKKFDLDDKPVMDVITHANATILMYSNLITLLSE